MVATEEQVSWNLSQKISDQLDTLIRAGRRNSIQGNFLDCFFMFKEIRLLINHHFSKEERNRVNVLEKLINEVSIQIKQFSLIEEDDFEFEEGNRYKEIKIKLIILRNKRFLLIEKYRKSVLRLLDEYGYLMERKKDAAHMF